MKCIFLSYPVFNTVPRRSPASSIFKVALAGVLPLHYIPTQQQQRRDAFC